MSVIGDLLFGGAGDDAAKAATQASEVAVQGQREALDYLKDVDRVPRGIRENALRGLESFYQVPQQPLSQEELIAQAKSSPLYSSILGSRQAGEESILRNASATGHLRSGNSIAGLSDYNMQLENTALLEAFNEAKQRNDYERALQLSGLADLASLPSGGTNIAQLMAGIGQTQAQGITAAEQARQAGSQQNINNLLSLGQLGVAAFCDIRLKRDIEYLGMKQGYPWYRWKWSQEGQETLGLPETGEGVLAHQVYEMVPDAVSVIDNFLCVNYAALGLEEAA